MSDQQIHLTVSKDDPDVAYLTLPNHPGPGTPGAVSQQKSVRDFVDGYKGPDVYLDFDKNGCLIGIEILA